MGQVALLYLGLCTLCPYLFAHPRGVFGGLCSVVVAISGHILFYLPYLYSVLGHTDQLDQGLQFFPRIQHILDISLCSSKVDLFLFRNTFDSRYLEFQGTL